MNSLLYVGAAMAAGLLLARFTKKIGLPNVTGYLFAGLLAGPYVLNVLSAETVASFEIFTAAALGFIAFSIGGEFKFANLKKLGKSVFIITLCEALAATVLVDAVLLLCGFDPPLAIVLGAIAAATAPAATLMVVRQYKAKGPVTSMLLPVVAMDDAAGLTIFAVSSAVAQVLATGSGVSAPQMILKPFYEIFGSLIIGAAFGFALCFVLRFFHSKQNKLCVVIAAVLVATALGDILQLSSLLFCLSVGAVFANFRSDAEEVLGVTDGWTAPLYLMFFVISGAQLNLKVLPTVGILGALYIVVRVVGKYLGASIGARITHAQKTVQKFLGLSLIPQAGVAIGMSLAVSGVLPQYSAQIRAVILSGTLVYELIGPFITKKSLQAAGEIERAK